MEKIRGDYELVKAKILDEYNSSDVSICEFFSSIICKYSSSAVKVIVLSFKPNISKISLSFIFHTIKIII